MNTHDLEKRVETLEKELESLNGRHVAHLRSDGFRIVELEILVQGLVARLKDFDKIEKIVFDAYLQNHPEAQKDLRTLDDMAEMAASFANIPTIKDARARR
jgi:hypothetical protein